MQQKKIPMRMCCGCGEMKPKRELIRVVKDNADNISVDFTGKLNGRGAYICNSVDCLNAAKKNRRIDRAFSMHISDEIYSRLEEKLLNNE